MKESSVPDVASIGGRTIGGVFRPASKRLGLVSMMSVCIGVVIVQGSMISVTQGVAFGGLGFVAAMLVAFLLAQFNAMSFAELALMFPAEGTLATYTQKAIGHFPAIVAVFAGYVVVAMLAIPVELFLMEAIIDQLLPGVLPSHSLTVAILLVLGLTNYLGTDVFARVQNLLTFIMVAALLLTGLCAVTGLVEAHPQLQGTPVSWSLEQLLDGSFIGLVAMAMWLVVGCEFLCPMVNEVENPQRNIPRAMMLSLCVMLVIYLVFTYGVTFYLDVETLSSAEVPYMDYANAVFGKAGLIIAALMALTATCATINTVLAAVPRMLHGMAENGQVFPLMKITSKRFGTPWVGILFMISIILLPVLLLDIDALITLVISAATSWLLAYVVAHINVMVLRRRLPDHPRPYRTPFYPLPQLLGIAGMLYVALNNSPSPEMTAMVYKVTGGILLLISLIAALWVKLYMKRGLFTPDPD